MDSRVQWSLTCRLTSEPDTMGTSWPGFCYLSRHGVGGGAQDLLRTRMAWAVNSKYLLYAPGLDSVPHSIVLLVLPRSLLVQLCCFQVAQRRDTEPVRPAHSPGGRCRQRGACTAESQAAGGRQ